MMSKLSLSSIAKYLLVMVMGGMAISCSQEPQQESIVETQEETREPITFNVTAEGMSRGSIMTTDAFKTFDLYAVDSEGTVVINKAEFTKDASGSFSTTKSFFWTGHDVTFYAYTTNVAGDCGVSFDLDKCALSYTMPTDVEAQPEIFVATTTQKSGSVSITFKRALALVQFSVKGADGYAIKEVSLSNFVASGTYDFTDWNLDAVSSSSYSPGIDTTVVPTGEELKITNNTGYLMVIPQAVNNLKIVAEDTEGNEKEYVLDATWVAGNKYNYTVDAEKIIASNTMDFDIDEDDIDLDLKDGDSVTLSIDADDATWESSDPSVAIVDKDGNITAVGAGMTTITITFTVNGVEVTLSITIQVSGDTSGGGITEEEDDDDIAYGELYVGNYICSDGTIVLNNTSNAIGYIYYINVADGYALALDLGGATKDTTWCNSSNYSSATDVDCGYYNTQEAKGYSDACSNCWNKGEVEALLDADDETKGHWYLPAKNELDRVGEYGDPEDSNSNDHFGIYNLYSDVGLGFGSINSLWSSTEISSTAVYYLSSGSENCSSYSKTPSYGVPGYIAVIRF
ncbi:MAG: fimbrillin family protein [Rikenellaceae bacterium]